MQAISSSLTSSQERLLVPVPPLASRRRQLGGPGGAISFNLGLAWKATLAFQPGEAAAQIAIAEAAMADLPLEISRRYCREIGIIRAVELAPRDESLAAFVAASGMFPSARKSAGSGVATTICRYGYGKSGDIERFFATGQQAQPVRITKQQALQLVFDLSLESAVEFERPRLPGAKRLARDALVLAEDFLADTCGCGAAREYHRPGSRRRGVPR
jgi:hypothetical protein